MKLSKKLSIISLMFITLSINIYSIEYAIGVSFVGVGPTIIRGDSGDVYFKDKTNKASFLHTLSYSSAVELSAEIGVFKYFGFDFGLGYGIKSYGYSINNITYEYRFNYISAPILLRAEVEFFDRLNLYLLVGPRHNFNIVSYKNIYTNNKKDETRSTNMPTDMYNVFTMDVSFSLGIEYRISGGHYIGLKGGYNMNVLSYFKIEDGEFNYSYLYKNDDVFMDNIFVSLTYKYIFNRNDFSRKKYEKNMNRDI